MSSFKKFLENYVKKNRKMLSKWKPIDDFDAGEISGRIEALELLLAEVRRRF